MFVIDTNVLSAMMSPNPPPQVAMWIAAQPITLLYTTAVCQAEVLAGLATMPDGRRRLRLTSAAWEMFADVFANRILPFDTDAALAYADIVATRRRTGRATPPTDLMIAAITRSRTMTIVTRNTPDFADNGVPLVNPWEVPA